MHPMKSGFAGMKANTRRMGQDDLKKRFAERDAPKGEAEVDAAPVPGSEDAPLDGETNPTDDMALAEGSPGEEMAEPPEEALSEGDAPPDVGAGTGDLVAQIKAMPPEARAQLIMALLSDGDKAAAEDAAPKWSADGDDEMMG